MTAKLTDLDVILDDMAKCIDKLKDTLKTGIDEIAVLNAKLSENLKENFESEEGPSWMLNRLQGRVEEAWDSLGHDRGT